MYIYSMYCHIYSMYGHKVKVYIITDGLVWSHIPRIYLSLGHIRPTSWDTHIEVATSACRIIFSYIYIVLS
jgi:hypothetical protein